MGLLQIVPTLPPAADGLGSYALALARQAQVEYALGSAFAVGDPAWREGREPLGWPCRPVSERTAESLLSLLRRWRSEHPEGEGRAVLLHYVGYGYHPRGCPFWLGDGLTRWRRETPEVRLITFFHEISARGRPWNSSFWLAPVQSRLAGRLAALSDELITSFDLYAGILRRRRPHRRIAVLPAVSSMGEPAHRPRLDERPRRIVVFGSAGNRSRVYRDHGADLSAACLALGAEEIVDVGPPIGLPVRAVAGVPVRPCGLLQPEEVSAALLAAVAGFLAYPALFLPKSSVFAAFCAHGVPTVCTTAAPESSGLLAGSHYLPAPVPPDLSLDRLQEIADAAMAWYAGHDLRRHAEVLHDLLLSSS